MKTRSYHSISWLFRFTILLVVLHLVPRIAMAQGLASVPYDMEFITTRLENFYIHHTKEQEAFAHRFGYFLEKHLRELELDLNWKLEDPVDIVVNDRTDVSNAFAASFPYNKIVVYPIAYETEASVSEYHDWVEELAIHELTHIVANDSAFDMYKVLKFVFGNSVRPNGIQPRWLIEGLAVFQETERTPGGRGRSTFTEAVMRMAIRRNLMDADNYVTLSRLNEGVFWWPSGITPYLHGYAIQAALEGHRERIKEVPDTGSNNQSIPGMISAGNAGRFPFALNGNLENIYGVDWEEAWQQLIDKLKARYSREEDLASGTCQLTKAGRYTGGASMSRDGWLYFIADHPKTGRVLARVHRDIHCIRDNDARRYDPASEEPRFEVLVKGISGSGASKVAVTPDGRFVAYAKLSPSGTRTFYDIYLYDVKEDTVRRITNGMRTRDPAFNDNGNHMAYVRNLGNGKQALVMRHMKFAKEFVVYESKLFERISAPHITGKRVYFSLHNNAGTEEIMVSRLTGKNTFSRPQRVIPNFGKGRSYVERHPFVMNDGTIIYSATYKKEDPNFDGMRAEIYSYKPGTSRPKRLTWSESGYNLWPIPVNEKQVLVSSYTISGLNLVRLETNRMPDNVEPVSQVQSSLHTHLTRRTAPNRLVTHERADHDRYKKIKDKSNYHTFKTPATSMWPQYWIPLFFSVPEGFQVGATTSGQDPLEHNKYFLLGLYDNRASFPTYSVGYSNSEFKLAFSMQASQSNNYFSGSDSSNRNNAYTGQLSYGFWGLNWAFGGGFQQRRLGRFRANHGFGFLKVGRSDIDQSPLAISPNSGYAFSHYIGFYPSSGDEKTFTDIRPYGALFLPGLWSSHSTQIVLKGAFSSNNILASNYFQGGGPTIGLNSSTSFKVRGYPEDVLFGQKIATANFSYTFPIVRPYGGWDVKPIFFKTIGMRFHADAGTAIGIGRYSGDTFRFYQGFDIGEQWILGGGADLLINGTLAYYAPTQLVLGVHRGFNEEFGGETRFFVGVNIAVLGGGHHGDSISDTLVTESRHNSHYSSDFK